MCSLKTVVGAKRKSTEFHDYVIENSFRKALVSGGESLCNTVTQGIEAIVSIVPFSLSFF